MSPEYLAQCIADNIRLLNNLGNLEKTSRVSRITSKAYNRHNRLIKTMYELDPSFEALSGNQQLLSDAKEALEHGMTLVEQYSLDANITKERLRDLKAIAYTIPVNVDEIENFMIACSLATLAAYNMGREDGLNTQLRFSVLPANKLGTD